CLSFTFFLRTRPPPRSTLFPYTTLFRSVGYGMTGDAHHMTAPDPEGDGAARAMAGALKDARLAPSDIDYINAHGTSTPYNDKFEDRKSTRLNSSHRTISYAVFCLKKKNK